MPIFETQPSLPCQTPIISQPSESEDRRIAGGGGQGLGDRTMPNPDLLPNGIALGLYDKLPYLVAVLCYAITLTSIAIVPSSL